MSNALVEQLRRAYPTKTAGRSDADLTAGLAERLQARGELESYRSKYPDFNAELLNVRNEGGDVLAETGAALKAGVMDRLPGSFQSAGALTADILARSEGLANLGLAEPLTRAGDYMRGLARENRVEGAQRIADAGGRTISRVEDIRPTKPRDYILWALPSAAENIPSMIPSLGAGVAGFAVGGPPGAVAAAGAVSIAQNAGDVYGELDEAGAPRDRSIDAAIGAGIPMGLLDLAGELIPLAKASSLFKGAVKSAILGKIASVAGKGGLAGAGRGAVTQIVAEGGTEALQELVDIAGYEYATGKTVAPEEVRSRLKNAAAAGGVLGGVTGAVFGLVPERAETPAVVPPVVPPPAPPATAIPVPPPVAAPVVPVPAVVVPVTPPVVPVPPAAATPEVATPEIAALAADTGTTPAAIKAQSETTADLVPMPPAAAPKVVVAPSKIEGQGVIAVAPIAVGEVVAPATVEGGGRTPAGRNVNHAEPAQAAPPKTQTSRLTAPAGFELRVTGEPIERGDMIPHQLPNGLWEFKPLMSDTSAAVKRGEKIYKPAKPANANLVQTGGGKVDIVAKVLIAPGTEVTVDYRETSGPLSIADPNPAPTGHEDASLAIALVAPDGKVHVFNASRGSVKADGTRDTMVHNTADLVPKKGTGKNRGLAQLTAAGWKLKQGPFKMAAERPNLHLVMTEAEFATQVEQSNTAANVVVESITQGRGDALAEQWLKANDAPGWTAFEWLRNKIAADTGVAPSHVGIGLATAANSVAKRAGLQAKTVLEKMKAGDVLRRTGSKIFGQFTDAKWGDFKNAVAEGKGDEFIENHFSKDGAVPSEQARSRYDTWALNMGELGVKDQAGGDAHVTGVETQVDENTAEVAAPEVAEESEAESPPPSSKDPWEVIDKLGMDQPTAATVLQLVKKFQRGKELPTVTDYQRVIGQAAELQKWLAKAVKKKMKSAQINEIIVQLQQIYGRGTNTGTAAQVLPRTDRATNEPRSLPTGGEGNASPNRGVVKSQPVLPDARWRASDPDVARRIAAGLSFLRDAGITVEAIQAAMDAAAGAVQAVGGSYSVAQRTMQLAMSSLTNPSATDLELLIHEAVHAMFPSMPPDIRAAVHRAIAKLPASGRLDPARNLSLQESDPAVRAEERLAVFMEGEGIRPGDAKDVASSLIRFFKDLYLKVARALATVLGHEAYADKLALRYFTSRLDGLMQGDAAPNSLINALGGRPLRFQETAAIGAGIGRELGEVVDGQMLWAPKVPDTMEAQEFNTRLAFSQPIEKPRKTWTEAFKHWFGSSKVTDETGQPQVVYHGSQEDFTSFDPSIRGRTSGAKSAKKGFFFTSSPTIASGYAELGSGRDYSRIGRMQDLVSKLVDRAAFNRDSNPSAWVFEDERRLEVLRETENELKRQITQLGRESESNWEAVFKQGGAVFPVYLKLENPYIIDYEGGNYRDHSFSRAVSDAQAAGHDGVILKNVEDAATRNTIGISDVFIVFEPTQVKSASGNRGTFDPSDPDIRFSRPTPQTPAGPYNPAVKINREVAIYNHGITVEAAVGAALTANAPAAAAEAAKLNLPITEWFRRVLHVESPEALRASQLARIDPLTQQPPPGLNPAATFADIKDAKIALETKYRAYEYLERIQRAVSKTLTTTLGDLQPALNRLQKAKDAFLEDHKRYENERGLSRIIELGVRKMIRRERKLGLRIGEQTGVVMQQLRQLDTRDADVIDREYGEVFKKLFDGPELRGHNLFEFLDQMVNEAGIDFDGLTIAEIQRKLADRVAAGMTTPEIGMLVGGDPRSRALLSTVVAWAKLDESGSTRANLARRRITNLAERMALQERLDKFIAEQDITDQALRDLVKSTKLEERTKVAYYRHKKKVMALDAAAKELQLKIDAASAALPVYREALGELQKDAGARPEYSFIDGEQYPVPTQNSKGEWEFPLQTLSLNSTGPDGITDSDLVARQVAEMSAWLRMMEATQTYGWRYFDVLAARDMLRNAVYESAPRRTQKWISNNLLAPIGDVARATGTAAGRLFAQSVGVFVGIETSNAAQGTRLGRAVDRTRDRAIAVLNRGRAKGDPKMTGARYMATVAEPALYILDGYATTDLREDVMLSEQQRLNRGMQRVINTLLQDPYTRDFVRGKEQAVAEAILAHSRAREEASAFGNSINAKHNVGVRDERILVEKSTGEKGAAIRESNLGVGVITVSKTWSAMVERVYRALTANGWASMREAIPDIVDASRQGGTAGVRAWLAQNPERTRWFTPELMNDIAGAMALNPGTGLFDTPVLADGVTRGEADPELSAQAWRASTDVWEFFDRMFDAHHGVSDRGQYVGEMLEKMHELWRQVGVSLDPNTSGAVPDDLSRLTSDLMINARTAMRFPQLWTKHLEFSSTQMHGIIRRIASQAAFGRESSGAAAMYATMQAEVKKVTETLDTAIERLEARSIEGKDQRRALEAQFGQEELARMERMSALGRRLEAEKHKFRSYFRKDDTTFDHNNWISALGAFITNGLLQTPGSMLNNLADTFAPLVSGGGVSQSTVRQVGRTWKEIGHDFASGMAEMVGLQLGASSVEGSLYSEERFNDGVNTLKLIGRTEDGMTSDIASAMRSSDASWFTNALQAWTRTAGAAITPLGEKATATGIRPFAPFTYGIMSTTRASVISTWQRVGDMVVQGMEYFNTHRADANNPNFKLTATNLGLTGTEAAAYEVFSAQMSEGFGLEITALTREAIARGKGPKDRRALLSPLSRALLTGFVSKHLTLDATIDSMTTSAWTSTPLRFLLPLWGWSMRRAMQVTGVPFDAEGRFRVQALGRGLVGLALLATSGFAMALMADEYFERIVGKKRNIRSLKSLPSTLAHGQFGEAFLTATENLNRAGTFGIWGEILNTGVNGLAEGGDNRTISLDSRVVMMSSMLGVAKAFSTLAATRDLDYTSVVRPFIMALGGNSALHYNQLANRALGLDTAESRFVERTSVQNELRVAGREIGLAVRSGGRGSEGADAMTPILSRMVLATYAGDRADFLDQWRAAVRQAREMGKEDPVSYVKDRFAARNPLKNVFQHISQDEYAKLIRSRDDDSRQRISGAVNRFNAYAESLDAKAYTGSTLARGQSRSSGGGAELLRQLRGF